MRRALSKRTFPTWLPRAAGVPATLYADFVNNRYWYETPRANFSSWLTALGATFTRSSTATYVNSSGLLATASSNVIRLAYNPTTLAPQGIVLEGSSTNLETESNTFNSGWTTGNTTVTSAAATSPNGSTNAWSQVPNTVSTFHSIQGSNISITSGNTYSFSVFVKAAGYNFFCAALASGDQGAIINLSTGATAVLGSGSSMVTATGSVAYPNSWWRFDFVVTAGISTASIIMGPASNSSGALFASTAAGNGTSGVYIYGVQLEALSFPTSYIATTGSTATRAAERLSFLVTFAGWNPATSTLLAKWQMAGVANNADAEPVVLSPVAVHEFFALDYAQSMSKAGAAWFASSLYPSNTASATAVQKAVAAFNNSGAIAVSSVGGASATSSSSDWTGAGTT